MQNWAVFTGDIVRSSALAPAELSAVFEALEKASTQIAGWSTDAVHFARYRGDGWQMALPACFALRAALVMRASVRATGKGRDTRIGIGLGDGNIVGGDLASADGSAFTASGRALDAIKRGPRMIADTDNRALLVSLPLADLAAQGWTPKQAQVAQALLAPDAPTHEALANTLNRSRQMTQKQADAAGISALLNSCDAYETE